MTEYKGCCIFKRICQTNIITKGLCKVLCVSAKIVKKVLCLTKTIVFKAISLPITLVKVVSKDIQYYVPALKPLFTGIGGLICWTTTSARNLINFVYENPGLCITAIIVTDIVYIYYEN